MLYKKFIKLGITLMSTLTFTMTSLSFLPFTQFAVASVHADQVLPGISATTDGVIKKFQPQKNVPGNGHPYLITQGVTIDGTEGIPTWTFHADETALAGTLLTVAVCGKGNLYVEYIVTINGPGTYVLDATQYGSFNQGLAVSMAIIPI